MSSFEVREATQEEVEWLKSQLDPPAWYLEKFLALNKKYGAIEVESDGQASRLKGSLSRTIGQKELQIRAYKRNNIVFLIRNDFEEKEARASKRG